MVMKFNKRFYKNQESRKGKRPNEQSSKENDKGSSKCKKVECFNCRSLRHFATNCPSPKDIKKSMQATWSDTNSEENASTTFEITKYDQNDEFLSNLIVEHEKLIKNYLKDHDILEMNKIKIGMLNV